MATLLADGSNPFHLVGGPTLFRGPDLLGAARLDPLGVVVVVVGMVWYLRARRRVRVRTDVDPRATAQAPLACWCAAMVAVAAATCSGLGTRSAADPSAHLIADTLLLAVAGPLLALAAPWTLAFAAAGESTRERIRSVLAGRAVSIATHPVVTWALVVALVVGLYFGGLYQPTVDHRIVAEAVSAALLVVGYLWSWSAVGFDPLPRRRGYFQQLCAVFPAVAFFTVVGMGIDSQPYPPAVGQSVSRFHVGGDVLWSTGIMFAIAATATLLFAMVRTEERAARQRDRTSDAAADAQLALWRATREAINAEEALARSTVTAGRSAPGEPTPTRPTPSRPAPSRATPSDPVPTREAPDHP